MAMTSFSFRKKSLSDGITNLAFTLPCLGANPLMLEAPEKWKLQSNKISFQFQCKSKEVLQLHPSTKIIQNCAKKIFTFDIFLGFMDGNTITRMRECKSIKSNFLE